MGAAKATAAPKRERLVVRSVILEDLSVVSILVEKESEISTSHSPRAKGEHVQVDRRIGGSDDAVCDERMEDKRRDSKSD